MVPREQRRLGVLDGAVGAANVDVRPHVLLPGQNADAAGADRVLQGQLLQRVRHVAVALGDQPDHSVAGAGPVAAIRPRAQHDRPAVAQVRGRR